MNVHPEDREKILKMTVRELLATVSCPQTTIDRDLPGFPSLFLHGRIARNMMDGWTKLGTPVVFVCFQDVSFHTQFAAAADAVVYTRGVTEFTNDALIETLFR